MKLLTTNYKTVRQPVALPEGKCHGSGKRSWNDLDRRCSQDSRNFYDNTEGKFSGNVKFGLNSYTNMLTLLSKLAKFANPPDPPKGSLGTEVGSGLGVGGTGAALLGCNGLGGAGLGGGCFDFFGGSAGLGLSGLAGGFVGRSGACKFANGSQPNGSLSDI